MFLVRMLLNSVFPLILRVNDEKKLHNTEVAILDGCPQALLSSPNGAGGVGGVGDNFFIFVARIKMAESSKPVGIMPNHLDVREITFTNLLLLDFNTAEMESKYRVVFNR